uniref:NADH dehydrogenase [ubiquinone] 1 beta subcomplex subunit 11, mitochondrial n=1 Tax=Phallusia mammillata TaxID=59560 RepID=A0A6F9DJ17_9ASCI|nr:uncharacterized protein LOC100185786 [Phallusia mammillata]
MSGLLAIRLGPKLAKHLVTKHILYRPATITPIRNLWIRNPFKKDVTATSAQDVVTKTEYEIELEKFEKKDNYVKYYGFDQDDPGFDEQLFKMLAVLFFSIVLGFCPIIMMYSPDFNGQMVPWRKREAIMQIEKRMAEGKLLIDPNYVPEDLIASMVPPAGDWEEDWLKKQASVCEDSRMRPFTQVPY